MDERKRPGLDDVDGPPSKRQAMAVNGIKPHPDTDMPWKDDIERYQKEAIIRQMKEYKSQYRTAQLEADELRKRYAFYEEQLPAVNAWFSQVLDELSLWSQRQSKVENGETTEFKSALLFQDVPQIAAHIQPVATKIQKVVTDVFARIPGAPREVTDLQQQNSDLLAQGKAHDVAMAAIIAERDQLSDSLEKATVRYMSAEKKLERARSAQVAKIEAQAIQASRSEPNSATGEDGPPTKQDVPETNGRMEDGASAMAVTAAETARKEATAVADKRAEQVLKLEAENKRLTEDLTAARTKVFSLSDEDYATSELYQLFKSQYEESIKRVNDLEARNIQLREEAQTLQAERLAYREHNDKELETSTIEMQSQLARNDADLARIRTHRDDLVAQLSVKEAAESDKQVANQQAKELAEAQQNRITALESENQRLHIRLQEARVEHAQEEEALLAMDIEALREKIRSLEKEYDLLSNELPSMAEAYKKASVIAHKKVAELTEWEEKVAKLSAEKAKADQKYFGAMRAKESREGEIRTLRAQNAKSSEIVSQLKDAESMCRQLLVTLEKQLAETKEALTMLTTQQHAAKQTVAEQKISLEHSAAQMGEFKKQLMNKDAAIHVATHSQRQLETSLAEMKTRYDQCQKDADLWKKRASGASSEESEMLRTLALCTVCRKNFKNTCLTTCGHIFCEDCVQQRMTNRARKCPNCGKAFGNKDYMKVTL